MAASEVPIHRTLLNIGGGYVDFVEDPFLQSFVADQGTSRKDGGMVVTGTPSDIVAQRQSAPPSLLTPTSDQMACGDNMNLLRNKPRSRRCAFP